MSILPGHQNATLAGLQYSQKMALATRCGLRGRPLSGVRIALLMAKNALRYMGFGLFMAGLVCMPFPVVSPRAHTSIFPTLAMSGLLVKYGACAMAIGAVLFALSFVFRSSD